MDVLLSMLPLGSPWMKGGGSTVPVVSALWEDKRHLLLLGSAEQGCDALLFQCVVTMAMEGRSVVYIRRQQVSALPPPVHGMSPPSAAALHNVKFLYLEEPAELVKFCASIHTRSQLPQALIVDNLDFYAQAAQGQRVEPALARVCACIVDALHYVQQRTPDSPCRVVMAADCKLLPHTACLAHLGLATASVTAHTPHRDGPETSANGGDHYQLSCRLSNLSSLTVHYSLHPNCLHLHGMDVSSPS